MEAIYEAILLIPTSPTQATQKLNKYFKNEPNFIFLLHRMAIELHDRLAPSTPEQHSNYQTISKQMLVLLNRFIGLAFRKRDKQIYLQSQPIFQIIFNILACEQISLTCKKTIVPSLIEVINSLSFNAARFQQIAQTLSKISLNSLASIFVLVEAVLESGIYDSQKIDIIGQNYIHFFKIAIMQYQSLINFYKNNYMQGQQLPNNNFLQILKQKEYVLNIICQCIFYIYTKLDNFKGQENLKELVGNVLMDSNLAQYLSHLLKIEDQLFDGKSQENLFGLKIIIASNLKQSQKKIINKLKSKCLSTLRLILSVTDKNFNLFHTDKLLMKELFNLADLIILQLIICSRKHVLERLQAECQVTIIISSMFQLLSQIVLFKDLKNGFESFNIQQIIRLTLAYMKTNDDQLTTFKQQPDNYFTLMYYICYGNIDEQQINMALGQFCLKRHVAQFIKNMSATIQGFHSILIEISLDIIKLQNQCRTVRKHDIEQMFLVKYKLNSDILECFDLESTIFSFTILLQRKISDAQQRKKLKIFLQILKLNELNNLQLCRVYICLAIHHHFFRIPQHQHEYYYYIEHIFTQKCRATTPSRCAIQFLQKLIVGWNDPTRQYLIFMERLLNEAIQFVQYSQHSFIYQMIETTLGNQNVCKLIINLSTLNNCVRQINAKLSGIYRQNVHNFELMSCILRLVIAIMKVADQLIKQNQNGSYLDFQNQLADYHQQISQLLHSQLFRILSNSIKQQTIISQQQNTIFTFGNVLCSIYTYNIKLNQQKTQLIFNFNILLLLRDSQFQPYIKKLAFKLLYLIINYTKCQMSEEHFKSVLAWMKKSYYRDQISLNRICIILQLIYFFITKNNVRFKNQLIQFFRQFAQTLQKKFVQILLELPKFMANADRELDLDRRKIDQIKINLTTDLKIKNHPITICRLYSTVLMNPFFNMRIISSIFEPMRRYMFQKLPLHDLSIQVLALIFLTERSKNIGVIQCFKFTTELISYNSKNPNNSFQGETQTSKQIQLMTQGLISQITVMDPYKIYCDMINKLVQNQQVIFNEREANIDRLEMDIVDYLKTDRAMGELVRRLTLVRRVNDQPRTILRIKRNQN